MNFDYSHNHHVIVGDFSERMKCYSRSSWWDEDKTSLKGIEFFIIPLSYASIMVSDFFWSFDVSHGFPETWHRMIACKRPGEL